MSTRNPLPYSNQFERGHSFNWAGAWKTNTHYFNDQYVTDFIVYDGCILVCRKNHLSTTPPEIILDANRRPADVSTPYWEFVVDTVKSNPLDISDITYDEQNKELSINYIDGRSDTFSIDIKISDTSIHVGPEPPENDNKIWIDTSDEIEEKVKREPDVIDSIQRAVYVLQRQLSTLMLLRTNGVISGNVTDGTLSELSNSAEPVIPEIIKDDYDEEEDIEYPSYAEETEPTINHLTIKMGTYDEIQRNLKYLIKGEPIWCTDKHLMYIFDNNRLYVVGGGGSGSDTSDMDIEQLQSYLDELTSISFKPIEDPDSTYTVRVNQYGQLIVYDKNNDKVQTSPGNSFSLYLPGEVTGEAAMGSILINSFYLGGLDKDEHSYQPCSHNYIELANITNSDINLNGLCLMYTYTDSTWIKLPLWGIIKANSTFLIRGAQCSVMDVNTTKLKVKTFDMEWADEGSLIKFDRGNSRAAFYLCWCDTTNGNKIFVKDGSKDNHSAQLAEVPTTLSQLISRDDGYVAPGYVDLVGVGSTSFYENAAYNDNSLIFSNPNNLFVRTYTLDPVTQSNAKGISKRNNKKYIRHIDLSEINIDNASDFTPKASFEHKTLATDKHNFSETEPNTLTCTFGIQATDNTASGGNGATRCFTWNSVDYYDEFLWYKKKSDSTWNKIESYKDGVDYVANPRATDPECIKTAGLSDYYTRIRWETFYGAPITTHKVMVAGLTAGTYEYKVGRADKNGNPSDYISKIREFTVRADSEVTSFDFIQTTDQQGANWEEYQVWDLSADYINRNERIGEEAALANGEHAEANTKDFDFIINTGDICYNGSRPNEWIDYYRGYSYLDDKEEMLTIGNNDLAPIARVSSSTTANDLYGMTQLGIGNECPDKVNHVVADLFYTQEMDPDNPPIFEGTSVGGTNVKQYKVPSLYSFNYGAFHFVSLNSEIRTQPENTEEFTTMTGEFGVNDVKADANNGQTSEVYAKIEDWLVRDLLKWKNGSIDPNYTRYSPQNCQKAIIYCHEMPFTITAAATYANYLKPTGDASVWRETAKANLNRRHSFQFQRLFKLWGIRLVFGGHKHTCSISYPVYDAPGDYTPYTDSGEDLMKSITGADSFNPIAQIIRTSEEPNHGLVPKMTKVLTNFNQYYGKIFNSTNTDVTVNGQTFNAKSTTDAEHEKPLCRFEIVDNVSAPTYVMCQATGFKNLSNSDTSAGETYCQYLRSLCEGSVIDTSTWTASAINPTDQLYPFYTRFSVTNNEISVDMRRVKGLYNPSSKAGYWNVNRDIPNGHEAKMNSIYRDTWAHVDIPLN